MSNSCTNKKVSLCWYVELVSYKPKFFLLFSCSLSEIQRIKLLNVLQWKLDHNIPVWMNDDYLILYHQLDIFFGVFSSSVFQFIIPGFSLNQVKEDDTEVVTFSFIDGQDPLLN